MGLNRRRQALYRAGLIIGGLLFFYQVWGGLQAISGNDLHVLTVAPLLAGWAIICLAFALQMLAWSCLMRGLGYWLSWRSVASGYMLSFLPRYIPGTVWGYVSRSEWLYRSCGVSYSASNAGSILEVMVSVSTGGVVILVRFLAEAGEPLRMLLAFTVLTLPFLVWWAVTQSVQRFSSVRLVQRAVDTRLLSEIPLVYWLGASAIYIGIWVCYGALIGFVLQAFSLEQPFGLIGSMFAFSASWLIGFAILFVPTGLGIREIMLSTILTAEVGIAPGIAVVASVMSRFAILLAEVLWLLVGIAITRFLTEVR